MCTLYNPIYEDKSQAVSLFHTYPTFRNYWNRTGTRQVSVESGRGLWLQCSLEAASLVEVFYDEDDGGASGDDDLLHNCLALTSQNVLPFVWRHSSLWNFTFSWQNAPYRRDYYQRGTESKFSLKLPVSRSQHISRWFSFPEFSIRWHACQLWCGGYHQCKPVNTKTVQQ